MPVRPGLTLVPLMLAVLIAQPAPAQQAGPADPPIARGPVLPGPAPGPDQATVLTLDLDLLYLSSAWGLRAQARLEEEGEGVAAENDRLTRLLSTEEQRLTSDRATLPAADFRRLAEDFDLRATAIRRERAQAVQDLNAWAEADRAAFFRAARPVMGQVMTDRGAVAVLDQRMVFVSLDAIDVTEELIAALDDRIGDGEGVVPLPAPPELPETSPPAPDLPPEGAPGLPASGQPGDPVPQQGE